ncbi:unnamed protein product, partial [Amoebophrya sp. A25]
QSRGTRTFRSTRKLTGDDISPTIERMTSPVSGTGGGVEAMNSNSWPPVSNFGGWSTFLNLCKAVTEAEAEIDEQE